MKSEWTNLVCCYGFLFSLDSFFFHLDNDEEYHDDDDDDGVDADEVVDNIVLGVLYLGV